MTEMEKLQIQGLELAIKRLQLLVEEGIEVQRKEQERNALKRDLPEWFTLEQAVRLKGGASLNTYKARSIYQPLCGIRESTVGGRKVWNRDTVLEWLSVTDDQLEEYKKECFAKAGSTLQAV